MSDKYIRLAALICGVFVISALTSKYIVHLNMSAQPVSQVLIADYSTIVRAMPKSATRVDIEQAYDIYNEAIGQAKDAGYIILDRNAALAFPDSMVLKLPDALWDLFEEIANRSMGGQRSPATANGDPVSKSNHPSSNPAMEFQMSTPNNQ